MLKLFVLTLPYLGNDEVYRSAATEQTVDYYEVAVGTDRSSPKTRDNVVPFTNVGKNTTMVFDNLDLQPLTAVYYVTVRAHSVSFASSEVSSNGITAGVSSRVAGASFCVYIVRLTKRQRRTCIENNSMNKI